MRRTLLAATLLITLLVAPPTASAVECHNNANSPHDALDDAWDDTHDTRQVAVDGCNKVLDLIFGS